MTDAKSGGGNAGAREGGSSPASGLDFTTLVLSLREAALLMLGALDAPEHEVEPDPAGAKYQIDLLGLLQDKTAGNLSDDEDKLLRTVLYDLRTAWLEFRQTSA